MERVARVMLGSPQCGRGDRIVVEFVNNRLAAFARRLLVPGNIEVRGSRVRQVDWMEPVPGRAVDLGFARPSLSAGRSSSVDFPPFSVSAVKFLHQ